MNNMNEQTNYDKIKVSRRPKNVDYEEPTSNDVFTVHGLCDYREERECSNGSIERRKLFHVTCNFCGTKRDLRKEMINTYKSCGCKKQEYTSQRSAKPSKYYSGKTLLEWEKETGISKSTLYQRMRRFNCSIEDAVSYGIAKPGYPIRTR